MNTDQNVTSHVKQLKIDRKAKLRALRPFIVRRVKREPGDMVMVRRVRAPKQIGLPHEMAKALANNDAPKASKTTGAFFSPWTKRWLVKLRFLADSIMQANDLAERSERRASPEEKERLKTQPRFSTLGAQIKDNFANSGNAHNRRIRRRKMDRLAAQPSPL